MDKITNFFKSINKRSLKYGSLSIILIAAVIAIAVIVNLLLNTIIDKNIVSLKWDLTANKLYSLGDESKKILQGINKDVTIYGLFDEAQISSTGEYKEVKELLDKYTKFAHIKVQYVDPDKNPGFIKSMDPNNTMKPQKQDFIVKSGNKSKKLSYYDIFSTEFNQQTFQQYKTGTKAEQAFTGAVKYVTSDKTPVVYFTEGHGENKLDSDYNNVKSYLEKNNYEVKSINLSTVDKVPDDAEILVVASPKSDLTADEAAKIKEYLDKGTQAVFMFDPLESNPSFAKFEDVLQKYNVSLNYDKVKENDSKRHVPQKPYDILPNVQSADINTNLDPANFAMILPASRSLNILKNQKQYITVTSLVKSSDKAVGEQFDKAKGKDNQGPLDLALAVEYKGGAKPTKILVMGNGAFMTDNAISQYQQLSVNGAIFFINSLNWLADKKDDTQIMPKSYSAPTLNINQAQASVMALLVVIVFPLIILAIGTVVWVRRRHL